MLTVKLGRGSVPRLWTSGFPPYLRSRAQAGTQAMLRCLSSVSLIPLPQSLALMNSSDPNYLNRPHLQYVTTMATVVSTTKFWGGRENINIRFTLILFSIICIISKILFSRGEGKHPSVHLLWAYFEHRLCVRSVFSQGLKSSGSELLRSMLNTFTTVPLSHWLSLSPRVFFFFFSSFSHACLVNRFPMGA